MGCTPSRGGTLPPPPPPPSSSAPRGAVTIGDALDIAQKTRAALDGARREVERTRQKGDAMQALLPPPPPLPLHAGEDDGPQYVPPPTPELERMLREEGVLVEARDEEGRRRQLKETADALAMLQTPAYAQDAREFVGRAGIVSTMVQMVAHAGEEQRDPRAVRAYVACEAVRAFDETVARGGTPPPLHVLIREAEAALRAYGEDRGDHCSDV